LIRLLPELAIRRFEEAEIERRKEARFSWRWRLALEGGDGRDGREGRAGA
jgi:hypothetical protein